MRRAAVALVVLVPPLALAGCGGRSAPSPTHAGLLRSADAVCASVASRIASLRTPHSLAAATGFATAAATVLQDELDALRKLDPPQADAATWGRFLASLTATLDAMQRAAAAAASGDTVAFGQALRDGRDGSQGAASTALGLGLRVCGRNALADA